MPQERRRGTATCGSGGEHVIVVVIVVLGLGMGPRRGVAGGTGVDRSGGRTRRAGSGSSGSGRCTRDARATVHRRALAVTRVFASMPGRV